MSNDISTSRRRFLGTAAMTIAAAQFGLVGCAEAHASRPVSLPVEGWMPSLSGATQWLNSQPLTAQGLRGKVVLVDFWTFSCINSMEFDRLDVDKSGALDPKELKLSRVQVRYPRSADLGK